MPGAAVFSVQNGITVVQPASGELSLVTNQDPHHAAIVNCTRNPEKYPDLELETTLQRGVTYEDIAQTLPLPNKQKLPEITTGSYDHVASSSKNNKNVRGATIKHYRCVSVQPSAHTAKCGTQLYDAYSCVMTQGDASKVLDRMAKEDEWSWAANRAMVVPMVACAGAFVPVVLGVAASSATLMTGATAALAVAGAWLAQVGTGLVSVVRQHP